VRSASLVASAAVLVAAALTPTAVASDATLKRDLARGVAQIRTTHAQRALAARLGATVKRLRADAASTAAGRRARTLAIDGFGSTLRGIRTQLDLVENDSGNIERAVRDAVRADRYLDRGARLLRAAGRALGIRVGKLNGH
jgi:hypothetical protein